MKQSDIEKRIEASMALLREVVDIKDNGNAGGMVATLKSSGTQVTPNSLFVIYASKAGVHIDPQTGNGFWINGVPLRVLTDKHGYKFFWIRIPFVGIKATVYHHRLAAYQKFGDAMFEPKIMVRHLDGDKLNNCAYNLFLGTAKNNADDVPKEVREQARQKRDATIKKKNELNLKSFPCNFRHDRFQAFTHDMMYGLGITQNDPASVWGPEDVEIVFVTPPLVFVIDRDLKLKPKCHRHSTDVPYLLRIAFEYAGIVSNRRVILVVPEEVMGSPIYQVLAAKHKPEAWGRDAGLIRVVALPLDTMMREFQKRIITPALLKTI